MMKLALGLTTTIAATTASGQFNCTATTRESHGNTARAYVAMSVGGSFFDIVHEDWNHSWSGRVQGQMFDPECGACTWDSSGSDEATYSWIGPLLPTSYDHYESIWDQVVNGDVFDEILTSPLSGSWSTSFGAGESAQSWQPSLCFIDPEYTITHWSKSDTCAFNTDQVEYTLAAVGGGAPDPIVNVNFRKSGTTQSAVSMESRRTDIYTRTFSGDCFCYDTTKIGTTGGTSQVMFIRTEVLAAGPSGTFTDVRQGLLVGTWGVVTALGMFANTPDQYHVNLVDSGDCEGCNPPSSREPASTTWDGSYAVTTGTVRPNYSVSLPSDTETVVLKRTVAILCNSLDVNRDDAEDILDRNMIMSLQGVEIGDDSSGYDALYDPYADQNSDGVIDGDDVDLFDAAVCAADFDGDGNLTTFDQLLFQNYYAAQDPHADIDGSGVIDFFDYLAYSNLYSAGCP